MKTQKPFKIGTVVQWNWMGRAVCGSVKRIYFKPISKVLRGHLFKRNGSADIPAYAIMSKAGNEVLKLHQELKVSEKVKAKY